jgi:hypothetical protein
MHSTTRHAGENMQQRSDDNSKQHTEQTTSKQHNTNLHQIMITTICKQARHQQHKEGEWTRKARKTTHFGQSGRSPGWLTNARNMGSMDRPASTALASTTRRLGGGAFGQRTCLEPAVVSPSRRADLGSVPSLLIWEGGFDRWREEEEEE